MQLTNGLALPPPTDGQPIQFQVGSATAGTLQRVAAKIVVDARERERERLLQEETGRERMRLYGDAALEKPKREQVAYLSDDGDLIYEDKPVHETAQRKE